MTASGVLSAGTIFTGVGTGYPAGTLLTTGTADPNFLLVANPAGTGAAVVINSADLAGSWVPDSTTDSWIGPYSDGTQTTQTGTFVYQFTFDLTGYDPASAVLSGSWAASDGSNNILNNTILGPTTTPGTLTSFNFTTGFVSGLNTATFFVSNFGPEQQGLLVNDLTLTANSVPEPGSIALMGLGLVALGFAGRKLRS